MKTLCTLTEAGVATLMSVWIPPTGHETATVWPISHRSGDVGSLVVTKPNVTARGIPIMWESTDTVVQSWFDHQSLRNSGKLTPPTATTSPSSVSGGFISTHGGSPGPSFLGTSTGVPADKSLARGQEAHSLSMPVLGAVLLLALINIM